MSLTRTEFLKFTYSLLHFLSLPQTTGKGDLVGCNIPYSLNTESLIKSSGDVKAITYCDLKSIQISGLLEVLRLYPEFAETFCNEIIHDLTFNLREGFDSDEYDQPFGDFVDPLAITRKF